MNRKKTFIASIFFIISAFTNVIGLTLPKKVMVVGSTGRLGRQVVMELLRSDGSITETEVTALVRNVDKANDVLPSDSRSRLKIVKCDLNQKNALTRILREHQPDAAIWCAAGFTDSPGDSPVSKLIGALKLKFFPSKVLDITALDELGRYFATTSSSASSSDKEINNNRMPPQVVMCSSAGVTRPLWSDSKKEKFIGASDIPIVRLNPLNILGVKRESEQSLRQSGCSYTILRPCGLNDEHPERSRPVLSQGDVAVGRICRKDVASLMVSLLAEPDSVGKTFETIAIPGLPVPRSLEKQLRYLDKDRGTQILDDEVLEVPIGTEVPISDIDLVADAKLEATYALLQQLVPGDILQPNALAMGQTYEQQSAGEGADSVRGGRRWHQYGESSNFIIPSHGMYISKTYD